MKLIFSLLIFATFGCSIYAQNSYAEAIQQGDRALRQGQYKTAINKYFAAEAFDPSKKAVVKAKVNEVFDRIETLRQQAEASSAEARAALKQVKQEKARTEKARRATQEALNKANKLIDAFYFYTGRFALAYGEKDYDEVFYFIDKNGDEVKKLGRWAKAEQFDGYGFAKVVDDEGINYLLDTTGQAYRAAYRLEDLGSEITALDLRGTKLNRFPDKVLQHPQLQMLLLDGESSNQNDFRTLPSGIQRLSSLRVLALAYCRVQRLPPEIGQLTNLEWLFLWYNDLTSLPPEIGQLTNLTLLSLGSNGLRSLPPKIGQLDNLVGLELSENLLTSLPPEIGQLNNLTELDLERNGLRSLPPEIGELDNLVGLELSENLLTSLPPEIGQLNNLTWLDLGGNGLRSLPPEIRELDNLTWLNLVRNELSSLPPELWRLTNLTRLGLRYNGFSSLPPEIGQLDNLVELGLSGNELRSLPPEIGELDNLTGLNLRSNELSSLPPEIGQLDNLELLDLRRNPKLEFKEICTAFALFSRSIGVSSEAYMSNIDENVLLIKIDEQKSLPPEIDQLTNLMVLDLEHNNLMSLPSEIGQLTNLTVLNLGSNELSNLLPEVGLLKNVTRLNLRRNKLSHLPPEITQLTNLTMLDLGGNELTGLPIEIGQLKDLKKLNLEGNPISFEKLEEITELLPETEITVDYASKALTYSSKGKYPAAYQAQKWAVKENPENHSNWFNLSFYALFIDRPEEAITAAQKTLELNPKAKGVETNLALGYLLNDEYEKAEAVYLKWKGKHFPDDERLCDEVFLKDIADLEAAGVSHPDFEKVKALFEK